MKEADTSDVVYTLHFNYHPGNMLDRFGKPKAILCFHIHDMNRCIITFVRIHWFIHLNMWIFIKRSESLLTALWAWRGSESREPYQDKLYLLLLIKTNASHLEMLLLCLPCWTNLKYIHPAHELWMFISTQFPPRIFLGPYYFSVSSQWWLLQL